MPLEFRNHLRKALRGRSPARAEIHGARDAAVLIPVVGGRRPCLILTLRTETVRSHKGQVSFPGGAMDPSESAEQAALRETHEELGIDPSAIDIVGALDWVPTYVSGFLVAPVVGWLDAIPEMDPNPDEVAAVLTVPIADLTEELRRSPGFSHNGRTYPTFAWIWEDHVIWGLTAYILGRFLAVLSTGALPAARGPDWN